MLWQHIAGVDTMASAPSAVGVGLQVQFTGSSLLLLTCICVLQVLAYFLCFKECDARQQECVYVQCNRHRNAQHAGQWDARHTSWSFFEVTSCRKSGMPFRSGHLNPHDSKKPTTSSLGPWKTMCPVAATRAFQRGGNRMAEHNMARHNTHKSAKPQS